MTQKRLAKFVRGAYENQPGLTDRQMQNQRRGLSNRRDQFIEAEALP